MNHLDTFSGIGGWALASRWMGWNTVAFVEKEKFCHKVLNKNFPGVPIHDDIFTFSGKPFRGRVDILTGSTPCQPFSQAGKRGGSNDERHLFPEFLRVVAEVEPRWIVIENVYGLLSIESGQVFEEYHAQLESKGYTVQTLCIPASALNAPHRRDRLWIVAHAVNGEHRADRGQTGKADGIQSLCGTKGLSGRSSGTVGDVADTTSERWGKAGRLRCDKSEERFASVSQDSRHSTSLNAGTVTTIWQGATTQPCGSNESVKNANIDGLPIGGQQPELETVLAENGVAVTGDVTRNTESTGQPSSVDGQGQAQYGRTSSRGFGFDQNWIEVAARFCGMDDGVSVELDIAGSRDNRVNRLKALGNAIVPSVAYEIFRAIAEVEKENR